MGIGKWFMGVFGKRKQAHRSPAAQAPELAKLKRAAAARGVHIEHVVQKEDWRCACCQKALNFIERCAEREQAFRSHPMGFRCSECGQYVCFDCWWAGNADAQATGKWLCPQCHRTPRNIE